MYKEINQLPEWLRVLINNTKFTSKNINDIMDENVSSHPYFPNYFLDIYFQTPKNDAAQSDVIGAIIHFYKYLSRYALDLWFKCMVDDVCSRSGIDRDVLHCYKILLNGVKEKIEHDISQRKKPTGVPIKTKLLNKHLGQLQNEKKLLEQPHHFEKPVLRSSKKILPVLLPKASSPTNTGDILKQLQEVIAYPQSPDSDDNEFLPDNMVENFLQEFKKDSSANKRSCTALGANKDENQQRKKQKLT